MITQKEYLIKIYQDLTLWLDEKTILQKPKIIELVKQAKRNDTQHIVHFSEVTECIKCKRSSFTRLPLAP